MIRLVPVLKFATFTACAYEAYAGFTRRSPTISQLCGRRRLLVPVIVGGLAFHLVYPPKEASCRHR